MRIKTDEQRIRMLLVQYPTVGPVFDDDMRVVGFSLNNMRDIFDLNGHRLAMNAATFKKWMGL